MGRRVLSTGDNAHDFKAVAIGQKCAPGFFRGKGLAVALHHYSIHIQAEAAHEIRQRDLRLGCKGLAVGRDFDCLLLANGLWSGIGIFRGGKGLVEVFPDRFVALPPDHIGYGLR